MGKNRTSIFLFRRDLRLNDNTALNAALDSSDDTLPCFIFDPRQIKPHRYFSANALAFMLECLRELQTELSERGARLYLFWGNPEQVLKKLITDVKAAALYVNKDYTSFSRERDTSLAETCRELGVEFSSLYDGLLLDPEKFAKPNGTPYTIFTPFFKRGLQLAVPEPTKLRPGKFYTDDLTLPEAILDNFAQTNSAPLRTDFGGRQNCLKILQTLPEKKDYKSQRDFPALAGTTRLSAHNKFGTCSIREVYHAVAKALGKQHDLIRELYWRDFFTHIAWHFPHVFEGCFQRKYDALAWSENKEHFAAWCAGKTGFPLVDAGMRELAATGNMHNRVRMVVASFLVKDLHISWRWGERFFAQHLVDYDPAVNNGNWQWAASTGCDAQPYFRIFNPWLQQQKFDPDAEYIKRWVPELSRASPKEIHHLNESNLSISSYISPIVDHFEAKLTAQEMFEEISTRNS